MSSSMSAERRRMRCPHCGYEWEPRVASPKRCPRCGYWLVGWERHGREGERGEEALRVREAPVEQEVREEGREA